MKLFNRVHVLTLTGALLAIVGPPASRATTFVVMSDADLVQSATLVVAGRVAGIATDNPAGQAAETHVQVAVDEIIKGRCGSVLTLVVPGGSAGGVRRVVYGAPQFYVGERVLLFLRPRADEQLTTVGLAMGKYSVVATAGAAVARRQLGAPGTAVLAFDRARRVLRPTTGLSQRPLRAFVRRLRALAGPPLPATARTAGPAAPVSRFTAAFTFLGPPPARWTEPDEGAAVAYRVVPEGDAALGAAASIGAVHAAMAAWSGAGSSLQLVDAGPTAPAPFQQCDGVSTIQFNDPFGEIGPPVNCAGVLAIGGFCTSSAATSTVGGVSFVRITEGDLTVNDGFGACLYWNATNLAEVVTHELGHTVGLGHSSENPNETDPALLNATMYYLAHFDGRGATLEADDIAGIQALYPPRSAPVAAAVRLTTFVLQGSTLVLSAAVQLPNAMTFLPGRQPLAVTLQDAGGMLFAGQVRARALRHGRARQPRFVGPVTTVDGSGSGVVVYTPRPDGSVGLLLRLQGATLTQATGAHTMISLGFGGGTLSALLTLQRSANGVWRMVPQ